MVTSVTSAPYFSYLNQLKGIGDSAATPTPSNSTTTSTGNSSSTSHAQAGQAALASLLSNPTAFSPEVLGLLQSNTASGIGSLLGEPGMGSTNALTGLLDNLYSSAASAAVTKAAGSAATGTSSSTTSHTATGGNLVNSLISATTQASISYNTTNLQNAKNTVAANSYGPDGTTPLTV